MSNWVWRSTEASREEGKISILAIVETLFFVLLTWAIAFYYNFYYYLFVPLVLTPFFMLKTPESVEQSHRMFLYEMDSHPLSKKFIWIASVFITSVLFAFLLRYIHQSYYFLLATFFIIFLTVSGFVITFMSSSGKNAIEKSVNEFIRENRMIPITSSLVAVGFLYFTDKFGFNEVILMFVIVSLGTLFWSGIISGSIILIRSFVIKIFATIVGIIMRPIYTLENIPDNWREQVLVNDIFYTPELLPEIRKHNIDFQLIGLIR